MPLMKSLCIAGGKITRKTVLSQSFCEYTCRIFEYKHKQEMIENY